MGTSLVKKKKKFPLPMIAKQSNLQLASGDTLPQNEVTT